MEDYNQLSLSKRTLRERIAEILRIQILRGEIMPGERIIEEEVSQKYQVSRGPVREALRQMEEEGLVTYIPHKGCVVTLLTQEEMSEAYLIRSTLEELAVKIYDGRMSPEGFEKLRRYIAELKDSAIRKDLYGIITADEGFHETIVAEAGCKKLHQLWKSLESTNTAVYHTMKSHGIMPYEVLEKNHLYILELLEQHRGTDNIVQAIHNHYMQTPETLHKARQKEG